MQLDDGFEEDESSTTRDSDRTMSELSVHVAINSVVFSTTSATNSISNRDDTGQCHSDTGASGTMTTSSGYEAGTCWSRDDDVITRGDDDDNDMRVSWSESGGSTRPPVYHLVSLLNAEQQYSCCLCVKKLIKIENCGGKPSKSAH